MITQDQPIAREVDTPTRSGAGFAVFAIVTVAIAAMAFGFALGWSAATWWVL